MPTSTIFGYNPSPLFDIGTGFGNGILSIAVQSDGKILVGGNFTTFTGSSQNYLIRLNSDGSKDTTFDIGTGFNSYVANILIDSNGKIICGGNFITFTGTSQNYITRLNSDGSRDTTFNVGTGFDFSNYSLALDNSNKIVVGGQFSAYQGVSQKFITRINTDGSRDTSFNIGSGFGDYVFSVAIDSNGKILASGTFTTYKGLTQNRIIRLNSDGSKDSTFNVGTGLNGYAESIVIQSDGKILLGGGFTIYSGVSVGYGILRLLSDGSIDPTFNIGSGFNDFVKTLAIQSDGKILAGGYFTTFTGSSQNYLIRLNSDGSKDTTFNVANVFQSSSILSVNSQLSNKILVGGYFSTFAGVSQNNLVRLNLDGSENSFVSGTQQVTNFSIVTGSTANPAGKPNNITFWVGPDEDLGYVIAVPVSGGTQTTPISGVNAFLGFYRSATKTEASFVSLVNGTFGQNFSTGANAKTYLLDNGYWTSYV